jgi:glycosyltransferase involved in cell wall biosynthesis/uncharacterized membrane protein YbhN (UPF0104 family)
VRVLFVTHNIPRHPGDIAGSFVLRLAVALRETGVDVAVIAPGTAEQCGDDLVEGIPIHRVAYAAPERMTLAYTGTMAEAVRGSLAAKLAFVGLFRALRRATIAHVRRARGAGTPIDVIHAHWWFPAGVSVWLARLTQAGMPPLVVTMHGSDVRLAERKAFLHPIMRRVLRGAAIVTAVSDWLARMASRLAGGVAVQVGPMPVDTERFSASNVARNRAVLFVGRLNAQKGVADLLEAFARVTPAHARLEIVGDGPDAAALHAQARALRIDDRVRWHGQLPQDALLPLYHECAVVAIPSREEGLGLVAVEAQLCGTPVVGYASGGLPDVVDPSHGGTLVPTGDIDGLAGALSGVLGDPAHAAENGARGRAAMLNRFAPRTVAGRYAEWYAAAAATTRNASGAGLPAPAMRATGKGWKWLQGALLVLVLFFAGRALALRWEEVANAARALEPGWGWILLSSAIVLATYAALVESWRVLIRAGGGHLPFTTAVRIWTVANLGRYIPGKVWSVGALGIMAQRVGVSAMTAAGAAILGTMLNIGAGFGVTALSATGMLERMPPYMQAGIIIGSVAFVAGLLLLPALVPLGTRLYARIRGLTMAPGPVPTGALWIAAIVNIGSWFAYGIAFALFSRGVTPGIAGDPLQFIAVFTASYLAGYLVLVAPGGVGIREGALVTLLVAFGMANTADAILLSLLSRLWLTVLEIVPGLVGLLLPTAPERRALERTS